MPDSYEFLKAQKDAIVAARQWVLTCDDDGHDYCIPANEQDEFRRWVESTQDDYSGGYEGRSYEGFALGGSPQSLTFENPVYDGKPWKLTVEGK